MKIRNNNYFVFILLWLLFVPAIISCSDSNPQSQSSPSPTEISKNKPIIYVTNYPLQYFAERIGRDEIEIKFPIPSDIDPSFWQPEREIISQLQQGDLIFVNGATYEKWLNTVSLPSSKLIDTSKNFQDQYIVNQSSTTHNHGLEGEHSHGEIAFTTWLNLQFAVKQAQSIRDKLIEIKPEKTDIFNNNYQALEKDLLNLDQQIENIVKTKPEKKLIASHPVYDYFQQRYQINLKSVHFEPDEFPTEVQWQELDNILKNHSAKWMIWEANPNEETVTKLKAMGINSLVFAPMSNKPDAGDFLSMMEQNIENLKQAFSQGKIPNN